MNIRKALWAGCVAAGSMLGTVTAWAQEEAAADAPAPVSLPSEIQRLTASSLLLDIANTGAHLIAVGDRGAVLVSNDGQSWAQVQTPTRSALTAVSFADDQNGWAVGHDAVIVRTADGGRTWSLQNFEPELEKPFLDVLFIDASTGFAVGAYGLFYRTDNGGETWAEVESPIRESELHFNSITRLNDGTLLIAGETGTLASSSDSGSTWTTLASPYESTYFGAVPYGDKGAVIFGLRGNVFASEDLATGEWREVGTQSVATMFGGTLDSKGQAILVGLNGNIMLADAAASGVELKQTRAGTPLSAAIVFGEALIAVGESGVQHVKLQ